MAPGENKVKIVGLIIHVAGKWFWEGVCRAMQTLWSNVGLCGYNLVDNNVPRLFLSCL